jgi:SAM-dependent methyltransferase
VARIRPCLGRLASRIESFVFPASGYMPPLHLRWLYYRTLRRDGYVRFAAGSARELQTRGLVGHHRVLDVGCGLGSLAIGLLPCLTRGSYDGFDVHAEAIAWCQRTITSRQPRFRFQHADLYNAAYNPQGARRASEYCFPYDDETFDFVYLGSVCTHLLQPDMAHYLREAARVLRPAGTSVVSFYLLNEQSLRGVAAGTSFLAFTEAHNAGSRVVDRRNPERAVAHPEVLVRDLHARAGLSIDEPICRGGWWNGVAHGQDVITAVK